MKDFDAFKILNISNNSSIEEIKKTFHKLIFLHHSDSYYSMDKNDELTGILIEAYKNALNIATTRYKKAEIDLNIDFKKHYNIELPDIENESDLFKIILNLLNDIENIFYTKNNLPFYQNLISFLKQKSDNRENLNFASNFLTGLMILVNSRIKSFENCFKEEYEFEKLRKNFISYINNLISTKDYLSFRRNLNSSKNILMNEIIFSMKKAADLLYKEEISAMLFIVVLFQEEDFYEGLFKIISKGDAK